MSWKKEISSPPSGLKWASNMRFVIPVVFYEITNVQCVYSSNTTIFIGRIQSIFYIRHNYTFWCLIMAIFRLYMKYFKPLHSTECEHFMSHILVEPKKTGNFKNFTTD